MIRTVIAVLRLTAFLLLTLPLMPLQWVLQKLDMPQARALPHRYHQLVCRIIGLKLSIEGDVPKHGLLVSNHISWMDIPVLSATCPVSFIAKKEVASWPMFGWLAKLQGSEFVNRESRHSTGPSANRLKARLAKGEILVLFAEGTSGNGRKLLPFKSAYFGAVENMGAKVTSVTLVYNSRHGLPLTQRQWTTVSWTGDQSLLPNLWQMLHQGPLTVKVVFQTLENGGSRKDMAKSAERVIRANLHAGSKIG